MARRILLILTLAAFFIVPDAIASTRRRAVRPPSPATIRHVFLVVLENQNYEDVIQQPFIRRLTFEGALLTNYHCVTHPSQPNYIAMMSGSTWGVDDDAVVTLNVRHLGDLLDARGLSWRLYAESYPGNCYLGHYANNDLYVRRHVPFLEFQNVITNSDRCNSHVVGATQLDADVAADALPAFSIYVPNQANNGHDTDAATADAFLEARFGPLLRDERFADGTLFILTFDESRSADTTHLATILWGAGVLHGSSSSRVYDHYDLLRTIEEVFHTGTLGQQDERTGEPFRDVLIP